MVLSLTDLCLISLRDGIQNGTFQKVHFLSPSLRQSLLNMILMRAKLDDISIETLSSFEFLLNLSSLSTQYGNEDDSQYLDQVAKTMAISLPNGKKLGDKVSELNLNLYGRFCEVSENRNEVKETNLRNVINLIAQCSNLARLNLWLGREKTVATDFENNFSSGLMNIFDRSLSSGGLLNRVEALRPCLSIMENLERLSLSTQEAFDIAPFLTSDCSVIKFKQLRSLKIVGAQVACDSWRELLTSVQGTLESLHLENVGNLARTNDDHWILPFPMFSLKRLTIDGYRIRGSAFFSSNLIKCPKLENVFLQVAERIYDFASLTKLYRIGASLRVKLNCFNANQETIIDCTRLIDLFGEKIKDLRMDFRKWNPETSVLLRHVVDQCPNLATFHFESPSYFDCLTTRQECFEAKLILKPFFRDQDRMEKLRELSLVGDYDDDILKSIFENCLNLDSLFIDDCSQPLDDYFVEWIRRGARPAHVQILNCPNVSDEGLIPILTSSSWRLITFTVSGYSNEKVTDRTWRALINCCPYVQFVQAIPVDYVALLKSKCLNSGVKHCSLNL